MGEIVALEKRPDGYAQMAGPVQVWMSTRTLSARKDSPTDNVSGLECDGNCAGAIRTDKGTMQPRDRDARRTRELAT
jgi:hypothetical protein